MSENLPGPNFEPEYERRAVLDELREAFERAGTYSYFFVGRNGIMTDLLAGKKKTFDFGGYFHEHSVVVMLRFGQHLSPTWLVTERCYDSMIFAHVIPIPKGQPTIPEDPAATNRDSYVRLLLEKTDFSPAATEIAGLQIDPPLRDY